MPHLPTHPAPPGRGSRTHHLGTSASCILLTILAANQAAARPLPSLPYLVQSAPMAMRLSLPRVLGPPPPPLVLEKPSAADLLPDFDPTHLPDAGPALLPSTPAVIDRPANPPATTPAPDIPPGAPGSVPLIPDRYGRPANVSVEDLLPFLLPAPRPVSRATYQIR